MTLAWTAAHHKSAPTSALNAFIDGVAQARHDGGFTWVVGDSQREACKTCSLPLRQRANGRQPDLGPFLEPCLPLSSPPMPVFALARRVRALYQRPPPDKQSPDVGPLLERLLGRGKSSPTTQMMMAQSEGWVI